MFSPKRYTLHFFIFITLVLSGCATKPTVSIDEDKHSLTPEQRAQKLLNISTWKIRGKIAFIEKSDNKSKRESASLTWQVNESTKTQELNLTTYLGINVLHLESLNGSHTLKVDGKEYKDSNLTYLIQSLTGIALPIKALPHWLKGLKTLEEDVIVLDPKTALPITLSSYHNGSFWQIKYSQYKQFDGINMATKFTIEKDNLLIKVVVNKWYFDE